MNFKKICTLLILSTLPLVSQNVKASSSNDDNIINKLANDNIMTTINKIASRPALLTNINEDTITEVKYSAQLLDINKDAENYLIIYKTNGTAPEELYRQKLESSGEGTITDKKLLDKLTPNNKISLKVMSLKTNDKNSEQYSDSSFDYYTKKQVKVTVKEDDKEVGDKTLTLTNKVVDDKVEVAPSILKTTSISDYYTYSGAKIKTSEGDYILSSKNIYIAYSENNIVLELARNSNNWVDVKVTYPTKYKENYKTYEIKKNTTVDNFLSTSSLPTTFNKSDDYEFSGYYEQDKNITTLKSEKITTNKELVAKFQTKIVLDNGDSTKELKLLTNDNLGSIDTIFFEKEKNNVVGYTIIDKESGETISEVSTLNDVKVDKAITIKAKYEAKTNKISVRQDDYNKRFGKVDDSIKNLDVTWKQTEKIGSLLTQLREKIKPNSGYEVVFRNNKKEVKDDDYVTEDFTLEIYFKKVESEWITVKFSGNGIDKFLSDGQEILMNSRLENYINLPSATGETTKELLGWKANVDYLIIEDGKQKKVSKDSLISTDKLGSVYSEKGKNLEFTAVYRKIFQVTLENSIGGEITLAKNNNLLEVEEGNNIDKSLENNKLIVLTSPYYNLSHFVANKNVKVIEDGKVVQIAAGEQITEEQFYNIVPTEDITIKPIYTFAIYNFDALDINNDGIVEIDDILDIKKDGGDNIRRVLGPLYYLR